MRPGKGRRALRVRELGTDRCPRALEEVLRGTEDAGGTLGDRLADPVAEDDYERVSAPDRNRVRALLKALDARERTIVKARFGLDGPERTLRQLGVTLGVSAERVRQVERDALDKLREAALASSVDGPAARRTSAAKRRPGPNDQRTQCAEPRAFD